MSASLRLVSDVLVSGTVDISFVVEAIRAQSLLCQAYADDEGSEGSIRIWWNQVCAMASGTETEQWAASQLIGLTMETGPVAIVRECCSSALDHLLRVLKGCSAISTRSAALSAACTVIERAANCPEALHTIARTQLPRFVALLLDKKAWDDGANCRVCLGALSRIAHSCPNSIKQHVRQAVALASSCLDSDDRSTVQVSAQLVGHLAACGCAQASWEDIMAAVLTELEFAVGFTAREHAVDLGAKTLFSLEPLTNHADAASLSVATAVSRRVFALCCWSCHMLSTGAAGRAARMVPAARMVALVEHVANSTTESNPWHRNISQLRPTEALMVTPIVQAELAVLIGQLASAARRHLLPLHARTGRVLSLLVQSNKELWHAATRAKAYCAATAALQALGTSLQPSLVRPVLELALDDIRSSFPNQIQQTTLKEATHKAGRQQNKRHKVMHDSSEKNATVKFEPSVDVLVAALNFIKAVLDECGVVLETCNRVSIDSVLAETIQRSIHSSNKSMRSLVQPALLEVLLATLVAPTCTAAPLVPHAMIICKAIQLDLSASSLVHALCKTILAVCTTCVQPRQPPRFDSTSSPEFSHDARVLYSSATIPASLSAGIHQGSGGVNPGASPAVTHLFGSSDAPVNDSTKLAEQPQPEAVSMQISDRASNDQAAAAESASQSLHPPASTRSVKSRKIPKKVPVADAPSSAQNAVKSDSDSDSDGGIVDDSPDCSDNE